MPDEYEIVTNARVAFDRLHFPKWRRTVKTYKTERAIDALDTETAQGAAYLVATSKGRFLYPDDFADFLEWLPESGLNKSLNFCWNLDFDTRALLSTIPRYVLEELWVLGEVSLDVCTLRYIPKKWFRIRHLGKSYEFFDLAQFYHMSLDAASRQYLSEGKSPIDIERAERDPEFRRVNRLRILDYCIRDASLTARLGLYLQRLFWKIGVRPRRYFSTGYVAEQYFLTHSRLPVLHFKTPQTFAYYAYAGGRFEIFQRGYFDDVYKYDIHSAYPAVLAELPDLDNGVWRHSVIPDPQADLSFTLVKIDIPESYMCPLHVRDNYRVVFPSTDKHYRVITKSEYEIIQEYDLADMTPVRSWGFTANDNTKPFAKIRDIYRERLRLKKQKDPLELALKIIMNSIYGKTIQIQSVPLPRIHYSVGNLFLPAYASEITAQTRVRLLRMCLENDIRPLAVFTDAVLTTERTPCESEVLGGWGLEKRGECVLIGSGVYSFRDSKDEYVRLRGFHQRKGVSLFGMLEDNLTKTTIEYPQREFLSLGRYIRHYHKYQGVPLNVFFDHTKHININFDNKRNWEREFKSCHDVLRSQIDSKPLHVNILLNNPVNDFVQCA